ncbi:CBS domain-containing protein [soil metagenome]
MHASDLKSNFPIVGRDTSAVAAATLVAQERLAGLVIADAKGIPVAVVSAVDVLGLLVPNYVLDDLNLAGVVDEQGAEDMWSHAGDHTIGELLDDDAVRLYDLLIVDADATILELAAQMADAHAQVALVRGSSPAQFVRLPDVMDAILKYCA